MKSTGWWIVVILLPLATQSVVSGQTFAGLGVKFGMARATVIGDDAATLRDRQPVTGLAYGFFLRLQPLQTFSLHTEFLFSQKGYSHSYTYIWLSETPPYSKEITGTTRALYYDAHLLATWQILPFLELHAGLYRGMLIWSRQQSQHIQYFFDPEDSPTGNFDFGYILGLALSRSRLSLDLRYIVGGEGILADELAFKNRQLMLLLGFRFVWDVVQL